MARQKREPKYKCQYCERPLDNSTTKTSHELACPKNPKNIKIESKETPPGSQSKGGKKTTSGKQSTAKQTELEKDDKILQQLPTISKLMEDVEGLKVIPGAIEANQLQIGQLADAIEKQNVLMVGIANKIANPSQVPKANTGKVQLSQVNNQADEALAASLAADKGKIGGSSEEKETDAVSKMEKLKREAEEKKVPGSGQTGQVETGGVDPSLAALADPNMPEGIQKILLYATVAEKFLPLINSFRGGQPQPAQTPDDFKMLERVYSNMTSVFSNALKLTQGFRQEARKEVLEEITDGYKLIPKREPPKEETEREVLE
ncbi:MAG TPA: hypothetical protein ENI13_00270 [candidate division CPR3 bacterium]|uniref:Uncharacterized protein n=1 Tax=candidate division CPR3 bacterium TaxID=2268181 RepID=A0A7C1SMQ9_UNCC3|nr:hypothetical protein [candidate division CPR3 bacterium]